MSHPANSICLYMHVASKRIELKSPDWSGFVENSELENVIRPHEDDGSSVEWSGKARLNVTLLVVKIAVPSDVAVLRGVGVPSGVAVLRGVAVLSIRKPEIGFITEFECAKM